ncbi:MAG: hypothetical protein ABR521_12000, partial [Gaiellaceae bacterium]
AWGGSRQAGARPPVSVAGPRLPARDEEPTRARAAWPASIWPGPNRGGSVLAALILAGVLVLTILGAGLDSRPVRRRLRERAVRSARARKRASRRRDRLDATPRHRAWQRAREAAPLPRRLRQGPR